jgi:alkylation response protein AidB-like acyl-CoA dehydrogenase
VDFQHSPEQEALRETVRAWLADHLPLERLHRSVDGPVGLTDAEWAEMARLGWCGLLVPEDRGGLGLGLVDAGVVLEEMGRVPAPGPYLSAAVLVPLAARHLGVPELLEGVADGRVRGAVAIEEAGSGDPVLRTRTRARRRGATWRLSGQVPVVLDAPGADWVLVPARTQEGIQAFRLDGVRAEAVPLLDPTRAAGRLELVEAAAEPVGPPADQTAAWRRLADDAAVALAAELVGVADRALADAIDYAKQRVQFDVPIAGHQVIQHKLVDMLHALELGRVGVHFAAWASDADDPARARAAAIAKAQMGEAAVKATAENIQVHGAVGFTWHPRAHYLFKRAKVNDTLAGGRSWQHRRVADLVLAET